MFRCLLARSTTDGGGFPVHTGSDIWAFGILSYLLITGNYCWPIASNQEDDYYAFKEGSHLKKAPWVFMPRNLLYFFNRLLDARRTYRASAYEIMDIVAEESLVTDINDMRYRMLGVAENGGNLDAISREKKEKAKQCTICSGLVGCMCKDDDTPATTKDGRPISTLNRTSSWLNLSEDELLNHSDNWYVKHNVA